MSSTYQTEQAVRPLSLFRRWKRAAGPLAGQHIPAAPFTALSLFGRPVVERKQQVNPDSLDRICRRVAERLADSPQGQVVKAGEAAFMVDLPGVLALGLGYFLQEQGIAPALAWGGLYRPGAVLEGGNNLATLCRYGEKLQPWQGQTGLAFLLERERSGPRHLDELTLFRSFDNRYHAGTHLLPPLDQLQEAGITNLIDLRAEGDNLPDDLDFFYRQTAKRGFTVYQVQLPSAWLTEVGDA